MFKKVFVGIMAVVAILAVAGTMTSCNVETGTILYTVDMRDFDDNMDLLRNAIEKDFIELGLKDAGASHTFMLEGEVKSCNKLASEIFQQCCKAVDNDRSRIPLPLALKGQTIALMYTYGSNDEHELSTYTFVGEDK